jgi:E1-E2 ATPase
MVTTPTLGLDVAAAGRCPPTRCWPRWAAPPTDRPTPRRTDGPAKVGAQRRPDAPDPGYCRCWGGNCDVVDLRLGEVVPADLRLLEAAGLECEESVLTRESLPVVTSVTSVAPVAAGTALAELTSCALMGTVVHAGSGTGGRGGHRRTGGVRPGRA